MEEEAKGETALGGITTARSWPWVPQVVRKIWDEVRVSIDRVFKFSGQCMANLVCRCFVRLVSDYAFLLKGLQEARALVREICKKHESLLGGLHDAWVLAQWMQDAQVLARRVCMKRGRLPDGFVRSAGACPTDCMMHGRLPG
ncbi:hypothetical protein CDL15_Pgr026213 [Punica granatum]|uniref:Uncharacterized protein n=1 Tax=Punica granatum TaxID=22663 RepID=A0A218VRV0_PUNGR|nr:hypothetical protein CDL15_Pgr026213 [Punica granatum]